MSSIFIYVILYMSAAFAVDIFLFLKQKTLRDRIWRGSQRGNFGIVSADGVRPAIVFSGRLHNVTRWLVRVIGYSI